MKRIATAIMLSGLATLAQAQTFTDVATVVRSEPKFNTAYTRQCRTVTVTENNAGLGTVIGGVAGGIIGNQVGKGSGKDAATIVGAMVGAGVGNRIGSDQHNQQTREVCENVPTQVQSGRIVTFNYQGQLFTVQFDR